MGGKIEDLFCGIIDFIEDVIHFILGLIHKLFSGSGLIIAILIILLLLAIL